MPIQVVFSGGDTVRDLTNGNAGAITQGQAVYATAVANTVDLATAAADNSLARVVGVVDQASIAAAAQGAIRYDGPVVGRFVGALVPVNGDEVYLSAVTAGSFTTVPPAGAGQVVKSLGYITDTLTYNGVGDLAIEVQLQLAGPKRVN